MNNQDIELRLQNIVNSDKVVSKQLAFRTKRLYKKLHFLAIANSTMYQTMHERKTQLIMAEKVLNEHREVIAFLRESQVDLQNQIHRLREKVTDLKNHTNKSESITRDDRYVYTKNAFKKCMLGECTKLRFHEIRTQNHTTLMGYVATADKLRPFQEKISADSKQIDETTTLWNYIKLGSPHLDEWNDLFFDEYGHHTSL
ncbi:uncharacterized protein LOC129575714 [Sitodiplosis mosellana]|uniref:uncharacterized protein LOC129575714 n=1 Tax=Sitodiplosis mosellana TaxID=263140 RepID=UPI00244452BE|nr:uncharacterized protein LOC129575714 [Sitodiplosis mosellana]